MKPILITIALLLLAACTVQKTLDVTQDENGTSVKETITLEEK